MRVLPASPWLPIVLALLASPMSADPPRAPSGADRRLVASGPDITITSDELRDEIRDSRRSGNLARVAATLTADGLERITAALADQKRLAGEARRRGIDRLPDVAREIDAVVDALLAEALETLVRAQTPVDAAAVRAFYEAHADRFRSPARRKARHIVVATEAEAGEAIEAVRGGTPFAMVASQRNIDATRRTGGDLGWVRRGAMVSVFEEVLFSTDPGAIGGPVKTSQGWHVVLIEDADPGTLPDLAVVEQAVIEAMRHQAVADMKARLRSAQPIAIDRRVLEEFLK